MANNLYIIAGCNGAGKTTASYTILPEILQCKDFVNADEIARGLSPFQPEKVAFQAGRIMLHRINQLLTQNTNFAFETTLATRIYQHIVKQAKTQGYSITLIFFWLENTDLAIQRVAQRVQEGGHHIPTKTIVERYNKGIHNLWNIYISIVDDVLIFDNSNGNPTLLAVKNNYYQQLQIVDENRFNLLKNKVL